MGRFKFGFVFGRQRKDFYFVVFVVGASVVFLYLRIVLWQVNIFLQRMADSLEKNQHQKHTQKWKQFGKSWIPYKYRFEIFRCFFFKYFCTVWIYLSQKCKQILFSFSWFNFFSLNSTFVVSFIFGVVIVLISNYVMILHQNWHESITNSSIHCIFKNINAECFDILRIIN